MNLSCYIASPYSSDDAQERQYRARMAAAAQIKLMSAGVDAFSPVPGGHAAASDNPLIAARVDHAAWLRQTIRHMLAAEALVVLRLPGWEKSKGLAAELAAWPPDQGPILALDVADVVSGTGEDLVELLDEQALYGGLGWCERCHSLKPVEDHYGPTADGVSLCCDCHKALCPEQPHATLAGSPFKMVRMHEPCEGWL